MTLPFKKRLRLIAVVTAALLVLAVVAWLLAPSFLLVDSGPQVANAEVVLGGEPWTRPNRAAEVFRETHPSLLVVSGNGDCEDVRRQLESRGVPASFIVTECKSRNTKENAAFSVKLLREHGVTNAVIVTSWYHSRRALACFHDAAPEITFYSRPTQRPPGYSAWTNKYERGRFHQEYLKMLYYWVYYGIPPWR